MRLLALAAGQSNVVDLSAVGGAKHAGTMRLTFSGLLTSGCVTLVDQSITGMFERRETIGL